MAIAALAAFTVFATVFIFTLALRPSGSDPVRARVASLTPSRPFRTAEDIPSVQERIIGPLLDGMANKLFAILPAGLLGKLRLKLIRAGDPITVQGFLTICLVGGGVLAGLGFAMAFSMNETLSPKGLGMIGMFAGSGAFLPFMWLSSRVRQRQTGIIKSLPDSFDLITTCVEAGLGLDAALTRVAEKVKGPFSEDLSATLREISMGRNRGEALHDLAERTGVSDLSMFVNAIIQAEQMGTSIGQVLRVQSEQMRVRRRQRAEEKANQAPVKMVFPLVLCILPTLFIVVMGPAFIELYTVFTNK